MLFLYISPKASLLHSTSEQAGSILSVYAVIVKTYLYIIVNIGILRKFVILTVFTQKIPLLYFIIP